MPTQLPAARTLREAVEVVIQQNIKVSYRPARFINATEGGYAPHLVQVCTNLIYSPDAVMALQDAIASHPGLLTLEDSIIRSLNGIGWGFDEDTIERAAATVQLLDPQVGHQRWSQ